MIPKLLKAYVRHFDSTMQSSFALLQLKSAICTVVDFKLKTHQRKKKYGLLNATELMQGLIGNWEIQCSPIYNIINEIVCCSPLIF
jgi:hypothetical protein